jgi:hypothetical protein
MCKAMASERTGCNLGSLGRGSQGGLEQAGPAASAALTAADPQIGMQGPDLPTPSGPIDTFQHPEPSAFERAGMEAAPTLGSSIDSVQQVPSMSPYTGPMPAAMSIPSLSSQSTELMFLHSNPSSALSGYSLAAGLQEAMQQMRLQTAAGPSGAQQQQQPGGTAAASASPARPSHLGHSESQGSGDFAQLLGQAQQQQAQQEQQLAANEDGPATVRGLGAGPCVCCQVLTLPVVLCGDDQTADSCIDRFMGPQRVVGMLGLSVGMLGQRCVRHPPPANGCTWPCRLLWHSLCLSTPVSTAWLWQYSLYSRHSR